MFKPKNTLKQSDSKVIKEYIVANSQTITVGDAVQIDGDGFIIPAGTSGLILGIVTDVITERGTAVVTDGTTGAELGSFRGTFTTASNNETVAKVKVRVNLSSEDIYSASVDAAIATTAGSNELGATFALAGEDVLDESSVGTGTQFISHGVDPEDSTRLLVSINTPVYK